MTQIRLGSSQDSPDSGGIEGIARAATVSPAATNDVFDWQQTAVEEYGLTTRWLPGPQTAHDANVSASPSEVAWVEGSTDDLVDYVAEYGETALEVPGTYGDIHEEFEEYFGKMTLRGEGYGKGITSGAVEQAIRILCGGGRYKAIRYNVIACGDMPWLIAGPTGTLLCRLRALGDTPDDPPTTELTIEPADAETPLSLSVPEADSAVLAGIRRFVGLLSPSAVSYVKISSRQKEPAHKFEVEYDDGTTESTRITGTDLARVGNSLTEDAKVASAVAALTDEAEAVSGVSPHLDIGDRIDDNLVVGYEPTRRNKPAVGGRRIGYNILYLDSTYSGLKLNSRFVPVVSLP